MRERFTHRALSAQQIGALQIRLDQPFGPPGHVGGDEPKRALNRLPDLVFVQPIIPGFGQCRQDRATQQRNEDKVVEMARLQGRILSVVGEREQLPRHCRNGCIRIVHPAQNCGDDNRRGRASPLCAQCGKAVEGSSDPLGLQPGYERLADRLLPAVTVRMGRPRFVTAMAVGACICERWDNDAVAADEITPPWLVWEWLLIEAFVRAEEIAR